MLKKGIYQHYKGQLYQVLHVATHSETQEKLVVYQCLYGDYSLWVRPLEMFTESITLDDDRELERFKLIQEVQCLPTLIGLPLQPRYFQALREEN